MKKALCIGINNYPGTNMDLSGCVNDAKDWAKALRAWDFKTATLYDSKATHAAILKAFNKLVGSAERDDSLAITYSVGHLSRIRMAMNPTTAMKHYVPGTL